MPQRKVEMYAGYSHVRIDHINVATFHVSHQVSRSSAALLGVSNSVGGRLSDEETSSDISAWMTTLGFKVLFEYFCNLPPNGLSIVCHL